MDAFLDILRELVSDQLFTFIAGFIFGVLACWRFCPAYWQWRTHRFDVEREDRLRREQEEKKRKTQERAAEVRQGLQYNADGDLEDCNGNVYCPACVKRGIRCVMLDTDSDYTRFRCPECGRTR